MNKKYFAAAVIVPLIILLSMCLQPLLTITNGEEILLQTTHVDPRDVFRGDYVLLAYQIEQIPLDKFPKELRENNFENEEDVKKIIKNNTIYLVLKKDQNGFVQLDHVSLTQPKDVLFLKAKFYSYYRFTKYYDNKKIPREIGEMDSDLGNEPVFINLGLDKYFVAENTGKELEEAAGQGNLQAKVKVLNGYGILTGIEIRQPK